MEVPAWDSWLWSISHYTHQAGSSVCQKGKAKVHSVNQPSTEFTSLLLETKRICPDWAMSSVLLSVSGLLIVSEPVWVPCVVLSLLQDSALQVWAGPTARWSKRIPVSHLTPTELEIFRGWLPYLPSPGRASWNTPEPLGICIQAMWLPALLLLFKVTLEN
jgi:hypothetical protein